MADGRRARGDAVDLDRHDLLAEQGDDALQRPHPAQALGRAEASPQRIDLGQGKARDDRRDRLGEHVGGRRGPAARSPRTDAVALLELVAASGRSCAGSLRAPAAARELRGPLISSRHRLGLARQSARDQRQPARRRHRCRSPRPSAPPRRARSANSRARSSRALACIRAGISSDSEFEQEVGHQAAHPFAPSTPRRRPWRGRGRGRYRPGARRREITPRACSMLNMWLALIAWS